MRPDLPSSGQTDSSGRGVFFKRRVNPTNMTMNILEEAMNLSNKEGGLTPDAETMFQVLKAIRGLVDPANRMATMVRHLKRVNNVAQERVLDFVKAVQNLPLASASASDGPELPFEEAVG